MMLSISPLSYQCKTWKLLACLQALARGLQAIYIYIFFWNHKIVTRFYMTMQYMPHILTLFCWILAKSDYRIVILVLLHNQILSIHCKNVIQLATKQHNIFDLSIKLMTTSSQLCILWICKYLTLDNSKEELTKVFHSLITSMSLFLYGIKIWGAAFQNKYLKRIEFGYTCNLYTISDVIKDVQS